jgi:hypothetical protein
MEGFHHETFDLGLVILLLLHTGDMYCADTFGNLWERNPR